MSRWKRGGELRTQFQVSRIRQNVRSGVSWHFVPSRLYEAENKSTVAISSWFYQLKRLVCHVSTYQGMAYMSYAYHNRIICKVDLTCPRGTVPRVLILYYFLPFALEMRLSAWSHIIIHNWLKVNEESMNFKNYSVSK